MAVGPVRGPHGRPQAIMALLGYTALSVAFFGIPVLGDPAHVYIGRVDATAMIWFLAWWPYALRHGLNPLVTHLVWAPTGMNLGWATAIPGAGILAAPITLAFGPVVAYNILCLLAPSLAAWTGFLLCRYITQNLWAALAGGYVFGFSTYELAHLPGNLNLTLIFLIPLCVLLVLRYLHGTLRPSAFLLLLSLAFVFQFSLSTEVFATMSVFGAVSMLLALMIMPPATRRRLRSASALILGAYAIAGLLLSPYLSALLTHDVPRNGLFPPDMYSSDLLNFLIPTPITLVGGDLAAQITHRFLGNALEEAYLGLPLVAIVCLFGATHWDKPVGRWLILSMGVLLLSTLGPRLHIGGVSTMALPWALVQRLPLINAALPARFMAYVFLDAAVIMAIWLSAGGAGARVKGGLAALSIVCLFPSVLSSNWRSAGHAPAFFETGLFRRYLAPGENVLVIPYGSTGNSMLWQAQSGMYFRMAGGYVGITPTQFSRWPIVYTLYYGHLLPDYAGQLRAFLAAHQVTSIVVASDPPTADARTIFTRGLGDDLRVIQIAQRPTGWQPQLFSTLNTPPLEVGGVTLYRVPPEVARPGGGLTPQEMDRRATLAEFSALLAAAETYRAHGADLAKLTPLRAEAMGLLPAYWGGFSASPANARAGRQFWTFNGLWLGPGPGDTIGVGLPGAYPALEPVLSRYGKRASAIFFPSPQPLTAMTRGGQGLLLMLFTPAQLRQLAEERAGPGPP